MKSLRFAPVWLALVVARRSLVLRRRGQDLVEAAGDLGFEPDLLHRESGPGWSSRDLRRELLLLFGGRAERRCRRRLHEPAELGRLGGAERVRGPGDDGHLA